MKNKNLVKSFSIGLITILLAVGILTGCGENDAAETTSAAASSETSLETSSDAETSSKESEEVTIIYTNDIHGYVDNHKEDDNGNRTEELLSYSNVAAMKENLKADGENVLLVDIGDHVQGTAYSAIDQGKSIIEIMNAAGYDISALGNHEFNYSQERLFEIIDEAEYPYIACNFYKTDDDSLVLPAYEILNAGNVKIAFIGITTPESYTTTPKEYFQNEDGNQIYGIYGVEDDQELYDSVQAAIDEIGDQADYIIALGHLGVSGSSAGWTSYDVIKNTTGLDAFIDGHSHTTIESEEVADKDGNEVLLTQSGCYLNAIGLMHIEDGEISTELVTEYPDRDENVQAMTDSLVAKVDEQLGEKIAVSDDYFYTMDPTDSSTRIVRNQETNLGDLIADSVYYYFNEVEELDCDAAIVNGGGIRTEMSSGEVTYKSCKMIQPFDNVTCIVKLKGSVLQEVLEYSSMYIGDTGDDGKPIEFGGFLQVAGIKFTVNSAVKSSVQLKDDDTWAGAPTGEYKVSDIQIYNRDSGTYEDLDLDKEYTIAGINYILRNNGNGYNMFEDNSTLVLDYVSEDYLVTAEYIKAFKEGEDGYPHLSSANSPLAAYSGYLLDYENPYGSGRITIK